MLTLCPVCGAYWRCTEHTQMLAGDGIHDDTDAIQALEDIGLLISRNRFLAVDQEADWPDYSYTMPVWDDDAPAG